MKILLQWRKILSNISVRMKILVGYYILNIRVKMAFMLFSIGRLFRQDIKLDWTPTLQQKRFFVAADYFYLDFLYLTYICMELQQYWNTKYNNSLKAKEITCIFAGSSLHCTLHGLYSNFVFYSTLRLSGQFLKNSFHFGGMRNIIGYLRSPCQWGYIIRTTSTN